MDNCIISVVGHGKLECNADTLFIELSVGRTDKKSSVAQEKVNIVINKIISELKNIGIISKNITTSSMEFRDNYEYDDKNNRKFIGQHVGQSVEFYIYDIKNHIDKAIKILDFVGDSNERIHYSQIFFLKNDETIKIQCREIAFKDAKDKAEHFAKLSNVSIIGVSSISETKKTDDYDHFDQMICGSSPPEEEKITNFSIKKIETKVKLYIDFIAK